MIVPWSSATGTAALLALHLGGGFSIHPSSWPAKAATGASAVWPLVLEKSTSLNCGNRIVSATQDDARIPCSDGVCALTACV